MSLEAETAILYRVVAMCYSIMIKQMMDSEGAPSPGSISFVTKIMDMSVDWPEMAPDHLRMESIASNLNRALEQMMHYMGVRRG